jgi:hypothetical protein
MAALNQSAHYERLFLLNRNLDQVKEILQQFREDGVIHAVFTAERLQTVEDLRADLSHVLTGMLHQRELDACVKVVTESEQKLSGGNQIKS